MNIFNLQPTLSLILPTRNEEENIQTLIKTIASSLTGVNFELCFVDDSDDTTPQIIQSEILSNKFPIRLLQRQGAERKGGLSTAVTQGLGLATGEYVCVMDSDLQHPPELIPQMLNKAQEGFDLVIASRYIKGGSYEGLDGWTRKAVSLGAGQFSRLLFTEASKSTDPLSGFFICKRVLLEGIEFRPIGFKILLELLVCLPELKVAEVPMKFRPREKGNSKANLKQGLLYLNHVKSLFFSVKGSARKWKFSLVGLSGLIIFLALLQFSYGIVHLVPIISFLPAFTVSLVWNAYLNRHWTFADFHSKSGGEKTLNYIIRSFATGVFMLALFGLFYASLNHVFRSALFAALISMFVNGLLNWRMVKQKPSIWSKVLIDEGVQGALLKLKNKTQASKVYLLPKNLNTATTSFMQLHLDQVDKTKRPLLVSQPLSYKSQRRNDIPMESLIIVPVVQNSEVELFLIAEKQDLVGFSAEHLASAIQVAEALREPVARVIEVS